MNHLTTFNALYDVPSYHLVDEDNSDSFIITSYQISASLEEGLRLALQKGHLEIAKYLLSKDVFGNNNNNNIDMDSYSFNWIMATFTSNPFPVIKTSPTTSITVSTQDAENNETEQQRATALYLLASAMTSCNEKLISFAIDAFIVKDISRRGELEMELVNYLVDKGLPVSLFKRLVLKNTENNDTPSSSSSTTISSLFYPNLIPTQETLDMAFREGNIPVIKYLLSLSSSSSTTPPFLSITDPIGRLEAAVQILYNFRNDRFITVSQMETNGGNMALFLLDHLGSQAAGLISQHHQLVQGNIIGGCGDDENSVSRKKAETVIHRTLDKLLSLNAHTELFIHFCSHLESHLDVMLLTLDRTMKAQNDYLTTWLLEKIVSNNSNIALQLKIDFVIPLSWTFDCFKNFSEILPLDVVTSEMIAAARRRVDQAAEMEHDDMEAAEGERHLAQEILDEMIQE